MALNDLYELDPTSPTSNSNYAGANIAENCAPSGINNALRALGSMVVRAIGYKSSDLSSSVSTNIAAASTGLYMDITGANAINSLGAVPGANANANVVRILQFDSSASLSHSSGAISLIGGQSRRMTPGDVSMFIHEGSGGWRELFRSSGRGVSGMDLLSTQTASTSATLDFVLSNYTDTYRSFQFRLIGVRPATDGATLFMRTSTDGGSNYDAGASDYDWIINNLVASGNVTTGDSADSEISLCNVVGSAVAESIRGVVDLFLATSTSGSVQFNWNLGYCTTDGTLVLQNGIGRRVAAADIDAVRFLFDSGNITSGLIQLYGIR